MQEKYGCLALPLNLMKRREFLKISSLATAGLLAGCAANPVTGKSQLMLVSEETEIEVDQQYAPHQFSLDYGVSQDEQLNAYLRQTGHRISTHTHRTHMPYSFKVVNATYVNAYAFPGGSIAVTRGILLKLDDEAQLAALLGHELGHVNARHTAQQMSKGMLTQAVVGGLSIVAGTQSAALGQLSSSLGMLGAGALLAKYSRDNEREADALGMEYMVRSGYGPQGFVGLMQMLNTLSKHKAGSTELLFATHPMSDERYQAAVEAERGRYASAMDQPLYRERFLDHTAALRGIRKAVEAMQAGDKYLAQKNFSAAEAQFQKALRQAPGDYAALVMMAKCQLLQKKFIEAGDYADEAKKVNPTEAQAHYLSGLAKIQTKSFEAAYVDFSTYDQLLPGNPTTLFFKGYALEGQQRVPESAQAYHKYLQTVQQGDKARHAYQRLVQWGYIKQ